MRGILALSALTLLVGGCAAEVLEEPPQQATNEPLSPTPTSPPTISPASPSPTLTAAPTASPTQIPTPAPETPAPPRALERGDSGPEVRALQEKLHGLRYWVGTIDGVFGVLTQQSVYAFQEYEGLPVTGRFDEVTRQRLDDATRPRARSTEGDLIEVDKRRQILFVVRNGEAVWVFNTSTGTDERYQHPDGHVAIADTPDGRFTIDWQVDGRRRGDLGPMWRPKYFHEDGLAIHGYGRVPPHRASHGCVRLRFAAMDLIWEEEYAPIGTPVWVYSD